jgi:iron complex outermembrane recepter protein
VPYATGKIRAYFNHIPLTNGSGISIVEHIDPAVIERIELTKGPASSVYGAGLGGTINITARTTFTSTLMVYQEVLKPDHLA